MDEAVAVMTRLNAEAAQSVRGIASAMTDVTGFGLLGHLHELSLASGVAAELNAGSVPVIDGALTLAEDHSCIAGGTRRNREHASSFTEWDPDVPEVRQVLACDATTSGGLLIAIPRGSAPASLGPPIGRLVPGEPGRIHVTATRGRE